MVSNRHHRYRIRIFGIFAGLLLLIPAREPGPRERTASGGHAPEECSEGAYVVVQEGRLSVDVQEADLGEVLAQIGRQANIRISSGPSAGKGSARFCKR